MISRIIRLSYRVIRERGAALAALAAMVTLPIAFARMLADMETGHAPLGWLLAAAKYTAVVMLWGWGSGAIALATLSCLGGQTLPIAEAMRKSGRMILPLTAIVVVATLGIFFGFLMLIVPGIMAAAAFSMAFAIHVVERRSPVATIRRCFDLSGGYVFSLVVIFLVVGGVPSLVALVLTATPRVDGNAVLAGAIDLVAATMIQAVAGVMATVAYVEIRRHKEGVDVTASRHALVNGAAFTPAA